MTNGTPRMQAHLQQTRRRQVNEAIVELEVALSALRAAANNVIDEVNPDSNPVGFTPNNGHISWIKTLTAKVNDVAQSV